jgi:nitrite reductase/ring-hydroxylating ferredoxin subunit
MSCRACSRQPSSPAQQPKPSRRGLLAAAAGAALALLAWPRALLGGGKSWVAVPLSKAPKLQSVGGSMQTRIRGKELLLVRDGQDSAHAVEAKCPHEFCDVVYAPESKRLECPCHDAVFDWSGKVLQGPPPRALATYPALVDGDRILIRIPE